MLFASVLTEPWQWAVASGIALIATWLGYPLIGKVVKAVGAAVPDKSDAATTTTTTEYVIEDEHPLDTLEAARQLFIDAKDPATADAIVNASTKVLFPPTTDEPAETK